MNPTIMKILHHLPYHMRRTVFDLWCRTTSSGKISDMGERVVVTNWNEMVKSGILYYLYHAFRYKWAGEQIPRGSYILDLGSGCGYGSWYLSNLGNQVVGFDPDEKTVEWASHHFLKPHFTSMIPDNKFDYITCFEVLEHTPATQLIGDISKRLSTGGTLFISTANATPRSVRLWLLEKKLATPNPAHLKEFSEPEFRDILNRNFNDVKMFGQCISGVWDFESWEYAKEHKRNFQFHDFELRENDFINCEVLIARCRN